MDEKTKRNDSERIVSGCLRGVTTGAEDDDDPPILTSLDATRYSTDGETADSSLNIQAMDTAGLRSLITDIGGVPPLSPLSYDSTFSSEDFSSPDSAFTSPATPSSQARVPLSERGEADGSETEKSDHVGARPKTSSGQMSVRDLKKKKREEKNRSVADEQDNLIRELHHMAIGECERGTPPSDTGFLYDDIMTRHVNEWNPNYPECPERVIRPYERCIELGLLDRCKRLDMAYATEDLVRLQHSEKHLETVKSSVQMSMEELKNLSQCYDSIYFNNMTYECSLVSLGSVIELMEQILKKQVQNGFALVRPPGHHAMEDKACGYSFFNNVAIAAKHAVDQLGLERVLIVDWDVHHGQGTQYMFYDDPRVLYFSIHRYEHGQFWPSLRESDYDHIGERAGKGYNINVPLNKTGMTNSDYISIFQQILCPVAYEFSPQLVLASCGYDSAVGDKKGEMEVTPACFAHLIHMVSSLAEGRILAVLEGGYCLTSLAEGVALTLRELMRDPCPVIGPTVEPCDSVTESILNVIKILRPYWNCFQYQPVHSTLQTCPYSDVNKWPPKPGIVFSTPENQPDKYEPDIYTEPVNDAVESLERRIDMLIQATSLDTPSEKTCLFFDAAMRAHKNHVNTHPERPDRISRIFDRHVEWGLYQKCLKAKLRIATDEELSYVHRPEYIEEIKLTEVTSPRELYKMQDLYNSVFLCQESFRCASIATGSTLNVLDAVLTSKAQNGVAIVRPPGHHAEMHTAMGFCFFNTVAIAAKYAQKKYGLKRVMVLDWDVHHGNGTQHVFDDDPSVLFVSLHRYDHGFFYPGSNDANYDHVGSHLGEGYNVNISWNDYHMGDAEYIAAFQQIVMPIAYEFCPELVLVSAGFDAAKGDPLGGYSISPEGYAHMTHMLTGLANGRVVLALEGGYNLVSISDSMASCTSVLLGEPCPQLPPLVPYSSAVKTICDVLEVQKKYWKCLKFTVPLPPSEPVTDSGADENLTNQMSQLSVSSSDDSIPGIREVTVEGAEQKVHLPSRSQTTTLAEAPLLVSADVGIALGETVRVSECTNIGSQDTATGSQDTNIGSQGTTIGSQGTTIGSQCTTIGSQVTATTSQDTLRVSQVTATTSQDAVRPSQDTLRPSQGTVRPSQDTDTTSQDTVTLAAAGRQDPGGSTGGSGGPTFNQNHRINGACGGSESANSMLDYLAQQGYDQMYAVQPVTWCPHLETVQTLPHRGLNTSDPCADCGHCGENWVCLVCYKVCCSRYVNEHMVLHGVTEGHLLVLSYADLSVWCYGCDTYVDNSIIYPAKSSAHLSKFGTQLPHPNSR